MQADNLFVNYLPLYIAVFFVFLSALYVLYTARRIDKQEKEENNAQEENDASS